LQPWILIAFFEAGGTRCIFLSVLLGQGRVFHTSVNVEASTLLLRMILSSQLACQVNRTATSSALPQTWCALLAVQRLIDQSLIFRMRV